MVSPRRESSPARLPSTLRSTPWLRRMRSSIWTSARRGTLPSVKVSGVRRLAIINGNVAFLAPLIGMVPFRRLPPRMRIRSIFAPLSRH